jgi:hypothetical protein
MTPSLYKRRTRFLRFLLHNAGNAAYTLVQAFEIVLYRSPADKYLQEALPDKGLACPT